MYFLKVSPFLLSLFFVGCGSESGDSSSLGTTTIQPKISNAVLVNPDIGFSDFHSISIHDYEYGAIPSYPETSTVYFRWYWSELEKSDGVYNFALIDKQLNDAKAVGKKLMFRVMAMGETDTGENSIPLWFSAKGKNVVVNEGKTVFVPDYTSSDFQTQIQDLLAALSTKYNDPDDITSVDIGVIGSWAEWHLEEAYPNEPALGAHLNDSTLFESPSAFTKYVTMHQSSFTRVPTVMLIGSEDKRETFLASAVTNGSGWRADCLGDKEGYYGPGWNHMVDGYPHALDNANAHDAWKQAPVQFETCNDMTLWKTEHNFTEKDVTEVFDYALDHHASLINAKSKPIPDEFQPAVQEALKKLGYRFELTSLTHSKESAPGSTMTISSKWINAGVAPSYYPYRLAYRFVDVSGKVERTQETSGNVLDWLPAETKVGDAPVITIDDEITVPALAGEYDLQIALVNDLGEAKIKLAIDMPQKENWYTISNIQVN
jgi:hypothetical protein